MFERRIKSIQFDGGGEFSSHRFKIVLSKNGISQRISCPHTPAQNGVARHIVETGLSLLAHSSVPFSLWNFAFETAIF